MESTQGIPKAMLYYDPQSVWSYAGKLRQDPRECLSLSFPQYALLCEQLCLLIGG